MPLKHPATFPRLRACDRVLPPQLPTRRAVISLAFVHVLIALSILAAFPRSYPRLIRLHVCAFLCTLYLCARLTLRGVSIPHPLRAIPLHLLLRPPSNILLRLRVSAPAMCVSRRPARRRDPSNIAAASPHLRGPAPRFICVVHVYTHPHTRLALRGVSIPHPLRGTHLNRAPALPHERGIFFWSLLLFFN
ncbi:hypothetical protein C8R44DRAFT_873606 [Mycena epipterygia]|nr:hypothetical protein C8R44DRAFT_873606 [Mycena epipterygia]